MYVLIHANDGIIFRSDKHFCWMDGYAAFRKGELVSGGLGKTIVYIHTYIHTYLLTFIHTYIHSYKHTNILVYILGKKTLGGDTKCGLFFVVNNALNEIFYFELLTSTCSQLIRDYGASEAIRCMSRLAKLCSRFLCDQGISIG